MSRTYQYIKTPDFTKIKDRFLIELKLASRGEHSHLLFIKSYLPKHAILTSGTIQTAVIGGTNYDFAVIEVRDGKTEITFREKGRLHAIDSLQAFTSLLDTHLSHKVSAIAVNLGFPLKYFSGEKGQPDGTLIKATKEHSFRGLLGHKIGEIVLDRYIRKHGSYTTVAVANDVVCLTQKDGGVTIGTGYNLGVSGEDEVGKYVINLEAGDSQVYEATNELELIDRDSANAGSNRFEKLISARYLPQHFNALSREHGTAYHIAKAEELAEIASQNTSEAGEIARELFDRSAKYVAAHIAGLYEFKNKPQEMHINAEGSLFLYGYKYQKSLWEGLTAHGITKEKLTFHTDPDSSLNGALRLLL